MVRLTSSFDEELKAIEIALEEIACRNHSNVIVLPIYTKPAETEYFDTTNSNFVRLLMQINALFGCKVKKDWAAMAEKDKTHLVSRYHPAATI